MTGSCRKVRPDHVHETRQGGVVAHIRIVLRQCRGHLPLKEGAEARTPIALYSEPPGRPRGGTDPRVSSRGGSPVEPLMILGNSSNPYLPLRCVYFNRKHLPRTKTDTLGLGRRNTSFRSLGPLQCGRTNPMGTTQWSDPSRTSLPDLAGRSLPPSPTPTFRRQSQLDL